MTARPHTDLYLPDTIIRMEPGLPQRELTMTKIFTIQEANSLIPALEEVFRSIERRKDEVRNHVQKLSVLDLLWGTRVHEPANPDYRAYITHQRAIENEVSAIEGTIQEEIIRRGLRFPSGGLEHGLVDFPSTFEGRVVYLCWQNGEPELGFWHESDAGFQGRQPITEEHRLAMGKESDGGAFDL